MLNVLGVEVQEQPEDTVEVAAIALALAAHMSGRGKALGGRPITIGGVEYQVDVGDLSTSPVAVTVNGARYWTSLDGKGLPLAVGGVLVIGARMRDAHGNRVWRMAYPLGIGGYWDRRGWSKKE